MPTYTETMSGGALLGGDSTQTVEISYAASGGALAGGSSTVTDTHVVTASGGVTVGGLSNYDVAFDHEFLWYINAPIEVDHEFLWSIGAQPLRWYVAEGTCLADPDCLSTGINYNLPCRVKFFQTILARSVAEVCEQLQRSRINWQLSSIKRWSRPADPRLVDPNDNCNNLEVVPFKDIPQCLRSTFLVETTTYIFAIIDLVEDFFFYTGVGGIQFGGNALCEITAGGTTPTTWNYSYESDGGEIEFGGEAEATTSFLSSYLIESVATVILDFQEQGYATTNEYVPALDNLVGDTVLACNECNAMPVDIFFEHNLVSPGLFYNFLQRGGLKMQSTLEMYYSSRLESWVCTQHFVGSSSDNIGDERWTFTFELSCTNNVAGEYTGSPVIKFSMLVARKNLTSGEDHDTRLVITFPPTDFCAYVNNLKNDFAFTVNLKTQYVSNDANLTPQSVLLRDGIGIFSSSFWMAQPYLRFRLLRTAVPIRYGRKDITSIIPQPTTLAGEAVQAVLGLPPSPYLVEKPKIKYLPDPVIPVVLGEGPTTIIPVAPTITTLGNG